MNGAESLARSLVAGGVTVCFANPGTSEMHFVAALDRVDGIRCVLCLHEGVVTGAADGYARMAGKPAATLLHLGPGLTNGLANLHNARRAHSPVVNIVGQHAIRHIPFDAPLTTDIDTLAAQFSCWLRTSIDPRAVGRDGAEAIVAAGTAPGGVATLILPADVAWGEGGNVAVAPAPAPAPAVTDDAVERAARALRSGRPAALLLGDRALRAEALERAARIAEKTGVRLWAETSNARIERGRGRVSIDRIPYPVTFAVAALAGLEHLVLVGAATPVGFFAYPDLPSAIAPPECSVLSLCAPGEDQHDALTRLCEAVGADRTSVRRETPQKPAVPTGSLDKEAIAAAIGALLPENAVVCDESLTTGRSFFPATAAAEPHDWLQLTGGAIGLGIPLAVGAAIACPDRKVIALQADGSGLYNPQGLWTMARERLDVLTVIWANRSYAILRDEFAGVGAGEPGPKARSMLSLADPVIDWVSLARGMGVEGWRIETLDQFCRQFAAGVRMRGPALIEVVLG